MGWVITQNWITQVVSSLGFRTVWHRQLFMKCWYNLEYLWEFCWLFVCHFLCQILLIPPGQNVSIPLHQNASILFVSNIYNRNMGIFWDRKLSMKSWHNLESLWVMPIFLVWLFGPKLFWYHNSSTTFTIFTSTSTRISNIIFSHSIF